MKKALIGLALAVTCAVAWAIPITGSIDSDPGGGMYATGGWGNGDAELSYSVSESGGIWTYLYQWETESKALSHIIFGVSPTFGQWNILPGTTAGWELGTFSSAQGNSNVGIPGSLYGLKFGGTSTEEKFVIVSDRAPMCGNFYAKDGRDGGQDVYAYNTAFSNGMLDCLSYADYDGYILVPDTRTRVPEPGTMALLGIGMLGLLYRKKSQPKQ